MFRRIPQRPGPLAEEGMPSYPPGPQCNVKGLSKLGAYAIRRLIDRHMLIEADHLSERARARVLEIAERRRYPLISSHTGTGGTWPPGR
jgi:microsomal dipeptidase-like Zn-dependent dipeptidase